MACEMLVDYGLLSRSYGGVHHKSWHAKSRLAGVALELQVGFLGWQMRFRWQIELSG